MHSEKSDEMMDVGTTVGFALSFDKMSVGVNLVVIFVF
jgi:hypothetical protein